MSRRTIGFWCAAALFAAGTAQAQITITQWNFNSNPADGNTGTGVLTPNFGAGTATPFGGIAVSFSSGDATGGSSDPASGDDSGWQTTTYAAQGSESGGRGVEFAISTANYNGIIVRWDQRHSNTSSRFTQLFYSTDGTSFIAAPGGLFEATLGGDFWYNSRTVDLSSIVGVNGNTNFRIRIAPVFDPALVTSYSASTPASTYAATGTNRFDMVTILGTPITSIPPAGSGQASPGAVCSGGGSVTLQVTVLPGANPPSTGIAVAADLTTVGGSASAALLDNGQNGDAAEGDNVFTLQYSVPGGVPIGPKTIPVLISDGEMRSSGTSLNFAVADCSQNSAAQVVISQVYGGGGNTGAIYNADFIELFNRSASPVSLNGWSVQYASAGAVGGFDNPSDRVLLGGTILPGQYVLVRFSDVGTSGVALPTPDFFGSGGIGNSGGRAALVRDVTLIATDCNDSDLEDLVGWGAAVCYEGAAAAGGTGNTVGITRKLSGSQDSNQNFNDFAVVTPAPRNRATGGFLAAYGSTNVDTVCAGSDVAISVAVSAGVSPPSTVIQVRANLSQVGGSANLLLADNGGGSWSLAYTVPAAVSQGVKSIPLTVTDAQGRADTSAVALTVVTCNNSPSRIVVSGFFGGGGNTGAPFNADHIEIFNRSQLAVDVSTWSVQYADAANTTGFLATRTIPLSGVIAAGEYRLIQVSAVGAGGAGLPAPDFTPAVPFGMDNQSGRIAVVRSQGALANDCASTLIEDLVGYGPEAICFEGFSTTLEISNSIGGYRKLDGCQDFDQNAADFDVLAPLFLPRNSSDAPNLCPGRPAFCDADWCQDGTVGVPDIFCFLADWFANDPVARNYGGVNGVPAIFAFLSEWFAEGTGPCP